MCWNRFACPVTPRANALGFCWNLSNCTDTSGIPTLRESAIRCATGRRTRSWWPSAADKRQLCLAAEFSEGIVWVHLRLPVLTAVIRADDCHGQWRCRHVYALMASPLIKLADRRDMLTTMMMSSSARDAAGSRAAVRFAHVPHTILGRTTSSARKRRPKASWRYGRTGLSRA